MNEITFQPLNLHLEDMLIEIAKENKIKSFSFPVYVQGIHPWEYEDIDEQRVNKFSRTVYATPEYLEYREVILHKIDRDSDEVVGISSKVEMVDGAFAHLKHLDWDALALDAFDDAFRFAEFRKTLFYLGEHSILGKKGFIARSGGGFHYHGLHVINDEKWRAWIGKSKEAGTDPNWCDLQLKRGFSILRMTSSKVKRFVPKVAYEVYVNA